MNSGWDQKVADGDAFRGGTGFPDLNFPGFGPDAIDWLIGVIPWEEGSGGPCRVIAQVKGRQHDD